MNVTLDGLHGLGLKMGGRYAPTSFTDPETNEDMHSTLYVGWTTNEVTANAARDLGAHVTSYRASDPAFSGWEVSLRVVT